jgi:molybdenum cofactor biosynthesis enzyme MoaA
VAKRFFIESDNGGVIGSMVKHWFHGERPVPQFPKTVQIQTMSGCNARCQFCPNGHTTNRLTMGSMSEDLFRKIVDEVVQHPVRRISPYLMNEPLADPRLPDLIRYITERKRKETSTSISTNATYLTSEMGERLIESGLDSLMISFHGIRKETYETSMGNLDWETHLNQVNEFIEFQRRRRSKKPVITVTMVHTSTLHQELEEIREYWNSRGVIVRIHTLENRSHPWVDGKPINIKPMRPYNDCDRLMGQAYLLWNGDAVLCCVDWERTTVLGNVMNQSVESVWQGEAYTAYRRNYLAGNIGGTLCEGCKVQDEGDFKFKPSWSMQGFIKGEPYLYRPLPPPVPVQTIQITLPVRVNK